MVWFGIRVLGRFWVRVCCGLHILTSGRFRYP